MKKVYGLLFAAGLFAFASCDSDTTTGVEETETVETVEEPVMEEDMTVDTTMDTTVDTTAVVE
ncbi:hypothetical protein [Botryobacter ruber]|uniref:hypothetical protein n=1 Tax=Botryobacter ruber TaxID=2171629 RepID=UPI000E0B8650|nr:hypothetical protein [Botryobacter ruber]